MQRHSHVNIIIIADPKQVHTPDQTPINAVFQITFKGTVSTRGFEGSIDVGLSTLFPVNHLFFQVRWPAFLGF